MFQVSQDRTVQGLPGSLDLAAYLDSRATVAYLDSRATAAYLDSQAIQAYLAFQDILVSQVSPVLTGSSVAQYITYEMKHPILVDTHR